jgi:hypothetical protein
VVANVERDVTGASGLDFRFRVKSRPDIRRFFMTGKNPQRPQPVVASSANNHKMADLGGSTEAQC